MSNSPLILSAGSLNAEIFPEEGAVLARLSFEGKDLLCKTPWSNEVLAQVTEASDEEKWVARWRGGWQLCAPNVGNSKTVRSREAFHGLASQTPWVLLEHTETRATLEWIDPEGLFYIQRTWKLDSAYSVTVSSSLENLTSEILSFAIAEHLILGSDFLKPIGSGSAAELGYSSDASIAELDYNAKPTGKIIANPTSLDEWILCSVSQPARVFSIIDPLKSELSVTLGDLRLLIKWSGLANVLIWQEFGTSKESPWNGEVFALGVEPTNIPHGAGANDATGPFIGGNEVIQWQTTLGITQLEAEQ